MKRIAVLLLTLTLILAATGIALAGSDPDIACSCPSGQSSHGPALTAGELAR